MYRIVLIACLFVAAALGADRELQPKDAAKLFVETLRYPRRTRGWRATGPVGSNLQLSLTRNLTK